MEEPSSEVTPESLLQQAALGTPPVEPVAPVEDPAPIEPVAGEEFEISVEDDSPLTQEDLDAIATEVSELGLNEAQANSLVKSREEFFGRGQTMANAVITQRQETAKAELLADPDFVGEKAVESFAAIHRAATKFGDDDLTKALNDPYIGNNLPLARFLKKIGDMISPDTFEGNGILKPTEVVEENAALKNLYPRFFEKKEN